MSHPNDFDIGDDFVDANIGSVLDGRYLLVRNVGSGGMGIVYEAQHQSIRSRHAVKILHKHLMARPEVVKRFVNEARAAGGLGHPNIVRSTDMGKTAEGIPYVVFEFLEGVTLKEELVDAGPLPLARVLDIAIQTASALEAAHKQKIIHRDVKPENVFLIRTQDGHDAVKLIDFGIAKFSSATTTLTSEGRVFGSPAYMAPEQLRDAGNVDARADIYALGVLLFELLTGKPPYGGAEAVAVSSGTAAPAEPGRLTDLAPSVPSALGHIVARALRRSPADRQASMAEIKRELEEFQSAWREGRLVSVHPELRSSRRWFAAGAALVVAVAVGAWFWTTIRAEGGGAGSESAAGGMTLDAPTATSRSQERMVVDAGVGESPSASSVGEAPVPGNDASLPPTETAVPKVSAASRRSRHASRGTKPKQTPVTGDGPPMFIAPPK